MHRLDYTKLAARQTEYADPEGRGARAGKAHPAFLEIDLGRKRRWRGLVAWVLLFAALSAGLVWFFLFFSTPLAVAIVAVVFMISVMALLGYLAGADIERNKTRRTGTFD